jgi:WD40 repeat protein
MSPNRELELFATYTGHTDAIMSLAISTDGRILASGGRWMYCLPGGAADDKEGMDGIKLWDLRKGTNLNPPQQGYELRGQPSAMVWAKRRDDQQSLLVIGTALGYLTLWNEVRPDMGKGYPGHPWVCTCG